MKKAMTAAELKEFLETLSPAALAAPICVWTYDRDGNEIENEVESLEDYGDGLSIVCR